ncbi:MAG: flagellar assembly protein FliX [Alphaproteobacteria bacterium]
MKVNGPGRLRTGPAKSVGKGQGASGGGFAKHISSNAEPEVSAVSGAVGLGSIEGLLSIQETPDPMQRSKSPGVRRAVDILDRLEDVRVGLLLGRFSQSRLEALVSRLEEQRSGEVDPTLAGLLDEIELRAKVELAKLSVI